MTIIDVSFSLECNVSSILGGSLGDRRIREKIKKTKRVYGQPAALETSKRKLSTFFWLIEFLSFEFTLSNLKLQLAIETTNQKPNSSLLP